MNITLGDCAFTAVAVRSTAESFIFFSIGQRELNELSE